MGDERHLRADEAGAAPVELLWMSSPPPREAVPFAVPMHPISAQFRAMMPRILSASSLNVLLSASLLPPLPSTRINSWQVRCVEGGRGRERGWGGQGAGGGVQVVRSKGVSWGSFICSGLWMQVKRLATPGVEEE